MLARCSFVFAMALTAALAGCGGKEEVKKNEGTIVNVPPTPAAPPGGASPTTSGPATNQTKPPPPIPKINE